MRVTSDQVDDILHALATGASAITGDEIADICRDWLDMAAVIAAVEAAGPWPKLDAAGFCRNCHALVFPTDSRPHRDDCPGIALRNAIAALTTGGTS